MAFSRTDTVQDYHFRKEIRDSKAAGELPDNMIGRTRQRRSLHNFFLTFDTEKVPEKPHEMAKEQLKSSGVDGRHHDTIKALFEKQHMWLKAELTHKTGIKDKHLKYILPVVSYYFSSGPWRYGNLLCIQKI